MLSKCNSFVIVVRGFPNCGNTMFLDSFSGAFSHHRLFDPIDLDEHRHLLLNDRISLPMKPTIVFDEHSLEFEDDHLHLTHSENFVITPDGMESFWNYLRAQCEYHDCTNILIEADAPTRNMDTVAAFTSGVEVASIAPNLWLALCFQGYEPDEISELFRQAARNRGANVEFFNDRDAALSWLRSNNPSF
jgi:hypothetical protein